MTELSRSIRRRLSRAIAITMISAGVWSPALGQVPVRPLGPIVARISDGIGSVTSVRPQRSGRLILNDGTHRQLLLLDSKLAIVTVIADSMPTSAHHYYGQRSSVILPFRADSTLLLDRAAASLVVIDPDGRINRVIAPPAPNFVMAVGMPGNAQVGSDAAGRLLFTVNRPRQAGTAPRDPTSRDSSVLVRGDVTTHVIDTASFLLLRRTNIPGVTSFEPGGRVHRSLTLRPLDLENGDDWAIGLDGSVAIVRAQDYHVDWIRPDGSRASTPKVAHEWTRLTDGDKAHVVDSLRTIADSINRQSPDSIAVVVQEDVVDASAVPDYPPPFVVGGTRFDADGNLWIRTTPASVIQAVYDVVDAHGVLIDRVRFPGGVTVQGFGRGVVYISSREGATSVLAVARIR